MSHVTHMDESCHRLAMPCNASTVSSPARHTQERVMSLIWMSHVTRCLSNDSSICVYHDSVLFVTCRASHSRAIGMLWHDSFICVTWLINVKYPTTHPPRAEEIDWRELRQPKFQTSFHGSPRTWQTSFHGSPQNFKQVCSGGNGSPRHSRGKPRKLLNLEIQIFWVGSPPWAAYLCNMNRFYSWHAGKDVVEGLEWCDMTHSYVKHDSF